MAKPDKAMKWFDKQPHTLKEAKRLKKPAYYELAKDMPGYCRETFVAPNPFLPKERLVRFYEKGILAILDTTIGTDGAQEKDPRVFHWMAGIGKESDAERTQRVERERAPVVTESPQTAGAASNASVSPPESSVSWRTKTAPAEGLDRFGNKLGTRTAKINAAVDSTPKTTDQIEKEAGCSGASSHLSNLVKRGFVVRLANKKYVVNPNFAQEEEQCQESEPAPSSSSRSKRRPSTPRTKASESAPKTTPPKSP